MLSVECGACFVILQKIDRLHELNLGMRRQKGGKLEWLLMAEVMM
jgi:hypothetical protein